MYPLIRVCAGLLGLTATFAMAAPAQAHHIPTCPGFNDPQCNLGYFYAHQAEPHVKELERVVDETVRPVADAVEYQRQFVVGFVEWCKSEGFDYCVGWQIDAYVMPLLNPVLGPVEDALDTVNGEIARVSCEYFGACD